MTETAVICVGPRWWGDPTIDVDDRPADLDKADVRARRREGSAAEIRGVTDEILGLPDGCVMIHTGSRGAAQCFATAGARSKMPMIAVDPRFIVDVVLGLRHQGWRLKVLVASRSASGDEVASRLHEEKIFVKMVHPWTAPPEPEPGTEPEPQGS